MATIGDRTSDYQLLYFYIFHYTIYRIGTLVAKKMD